MLALQQSAPLFSPVKKTPPAISNEQLIICEFTQAFDQKHH